MSLGPGERGLLTTEDLVKKAFNMAAEAHQVVPLGLDASGNWNPIFVGDDGALSVYGQSKVSTLNSTQSNIANGASFTGSAENCSGYSHIKINAKFSLGSTSAMVLDVAWSYDGTTFPGYPTDVFNIQPNDLGGIVVVQVRAPYFRVSVSNFTGSTATSVDIRPILFRFPAELTPIKNNTRNGGFSNPLYGTSPLWCQTSDLDVPSNGPFFWSETGKFTPMPVQIGDASYSGYMASLALISGTTYALETKDSVANSLVPGPYDDIVLTYTGSNPTLVEYKLGAAVVSELTLTWTGSRLDRVQRTGP